MKIKHTENNGKSESTTFTRTETMKVYSQFGDIYSAYISLLIDKSSLIILDISITCFLIKSHVQRRHRPKQFIPKIKNVFEGLNRQRFNIIDRSTTRAETPLSLSEFEELLSHAG